MSDRIRTRAQRSEPIVSNRRLLQYRSSIPVIGWALVAFFAVVSAIGGAEVRFDARGIALTLTAVLFTIFAVHKGALAGWLIAPRALKISLGMLVVYALLQAVPLPPDVWQRLPGQMLRYEVLRSAGLVDSWQPISLSPIFALYSAIMAVAFVVALLALLALRDHEYRALVALVVGSTAVGILLGIVQIATGGTFPRFYNAADHSALIGLYANKNHMALAMAASILLAHVLLVDRRAKWSSPRQLAFNGYWIVVVLSLPLTNSRAGVVFGVIASAAVTWSMLEKRSWKLRAFFGAAFATIAIVFAVTPLPKLLIGRFSTVTQDDRWEIFTRSASLLESYKFFGFGLGSFREVFATIEKIDWLEPSYINNAHNDYLQIVLEFGVIGALIVVALLVAVVGSALKLRSVSDGNARHAAWAGLVVVVLFALHSFVDYPLRRPAAVVIFLVSLAGVVRVYGATLRRSDVQPAEKNSLGR